MNEIKNYEENINNEIYKEYFGYQDTSLLAKNLLKDTQVKNNQKESKAIYSMNVLRNAVIRKEIPEIENPVKVINIG